MTTAPTLSRCRGALLVAAGAYLALLPTGALSFWRSLAFGAAAVLAIVVVVLRRQDASPPAPLPGRALPLVVVAWAVWSGASLAWSVDPKFTLNEVRADVAWGLATAAIFHVAVTALPDAFERLAMTLIASLAFWTALAAGIALSPLGWDTEPFHRGDGAFATYLVTAAPFVLLLAWPQPAGLRRGPASWIALALLIVLLVVTARMSENRIVWIAFAASLVIATIAVPPARGRGIALAAIATMVVAFGLLFADAAHDRAKLVRPQDESVAGAIAGDPRIAIWSHARERIRERPWLGYGYGLHILGREIGRDTGDAKVKHPHNLFASQWLQVGAIGAALFVAMFVLAAARFVRHVRSGDAKLAMLGALGLAVLAGFTIRNLTDDFFLRANGKLLFATSAMLLGAAAMRSRDVVIAVRSS